MSSTDTRSGTCPVCDAVVTLGADTQESEVVSCSECKSRLVVNEVSANSITLSKAPQIEEDWGE